MNRTLTGYGPRQRLSFDGDEAKYELWEIKFLGYMRLQKLHEVIVPKEGEEETAPEAVKNGDAFAELVQYLDDRSLSLVMRDAVNDGRKALKILRAHYIGTGKPRIIALYTELTTLKMATEECVTDYVIRAETSTTSLKTAGENISDSLLIAMVLKGLPPEYKTFSAIVNQKDKQPTYPEFKVALRSYEETVKCQSEATPSEDSVMNLKQNDHQPVTCYSCGKIGHKSFECKNKIQKKKGKWCSICKTTTHNTAQCRKKDTVKTVTDNHENCGYDFFSKVSDDAVGVCYSKTVGDHKLLVDCGATTHIVHDKSKFVNFDKAFNAEDHFIELADGSRTNGVVSGRGDASVLLYDINGRPKKMLLQNALYVPSYKQDIFSVQAATDRGATVNFNQHSAELKSPDGTCFDVKKQGRLYYLNNNVTSKSISHTLEDWHKILGHCNTKDVIKLEEVVDGMKISSKKEFECDTCIRGKMSQYRSREPDRRATCPL